MSKMAISTRERALRSNRIFVVGLNGFGYTPRIAVAAGVCFFPPSSIPAAGS